MLRTPLLRIGLVLALSATLTAQQGQKPRQESHGQLFPPKDLGLLEAPDRADWQYPDEVMDKLGIAEASVVADIGAGAGWFTIRVARRIGPNGLVYAEDVQQEMLTAIKRRADAENLLNVRTVLGKESDPGLPAGIDAVLMVGAYREVKDRVTLLRNIAHALRPNGRLGVIDFKLEGSGPGPDPEERVSPETVLNDAKRAGLRLLSQETFLPYQYLLIFDSTTPSAAVRRTARRPGAPRSQ